METASSFFSSIMGRSGRSSDHPAATITSIFIYPIKSCKGISVPRAPITSTGFRWDRQWLVVNSKGRAYTQRVEPKLALVEVELPADAFNQDWEPTGDSYLVLKAPGMDLLKVPLNRTCNVIDGISVWEWAGSAFDEGTEASEWFSSYLGKPSRLVCFNTRSEVRAVDPLYAQGYKVVFSDEYPFMVISQVPTVNQENGIPGTEPTETLKKFRSDSVLNLKKKQGKVYFGQNLVCKESLSTPDTGKSVAVGDAVYVLEKLSSITDASV